MNSKKQIDFIVHTLTLLSVICIVALSLVLSKLVDINYTFLIMLILTPICLEMVYVNAWSNYCRDMRLIKGETKKIIRRKRKILKLHAKTNELEQKKAQDAQLNVLNKRIKNLKKEIKG